MLTADHHYIAAMPLSSGGVIAGEFLCWECVVVALITKQKSTHGNRRKCLLYKKCGKQDLNLHPLAGTRPST
jgi:hypothetical protein